MKCTDPRAPNLPRIFDHKAYAAAARRDHDERMATTRKLYRVQPEKDQAPVIGFFVGLGLIVLAASLLLMRPH
jgi:hypothetical protein